tara:strand:+ start:1496 stop:2683 length:1188 start_codon:yes stop_codon:yes gene_type:complete
LGELDGDTPLPEYDPMWLALIEDDNLFGARSALYSDPSLENLGGACPVTMYAGNGAVVSLTINEFPYIHIAGIAGDAATAAPLKLATQEYSYFDVMYDEEQEQWAIFMALGTAESNTLETRAVHVQLIDGEFSIVFEVELTLNIGHYVDPLLDVIKLSPSGRLAIIQFYEEDDVSTVQYHSMAVVDVFNGVYTSSRLREYVGIYLPACAWLSKRTSNGREIYALLDGIGGNAASWELTCVAPNYFNGAIYLDTYYTSAPISGPLVRAKDVEWVEGGIDKVAFTFDAACEGSRIQVYDFSNATFENYEVTGTVDISSYTSGELNVYASGCWSADKETIHVPGYTNGLVIFDVANQSEQFINLPEVIIPSNDTLCHFVPPGPIEINFVCSLPDAGVN